MSPVVRNHVLIVTAAVVAVLVAIALGRSESMGWVAAIALVTGHAVAIGFAVWGVAKARRARRAKGGKPLPD